MKYDENYSPGMEKGCLVGDFIYDASKGVTGTVVGYGSRYGNLCYEYDVKPGVVLSARREDIMNLTKLKEKTMQETKSNKSSHKDFKVGDTVYCVLFGKGTVERDNDSPSYPVFVRFDSGCFAVYTKEGHYDSKGVRTLFFSPATISGGATEKPFKSDLIGKDVLIEFDSNSRVAFLPFTVTKEDERSIGGIHQGLHLQYGKHVIKSIQILGEKITF